MTAEAEVQEMPMLMCAPPDKARDLWPTCRPFIDAGYAEADEIMPEDILEQLTKAQMLLWIVCIGNEIVAAMTTRLLMKRSGKVCYMVSAGGKRLDLWKHFHTKIEEYARNEKCVSVILEGRGGWLRALDGYTETRRVIEKRL